MIVHRIRQLVREQVDNPVVSAQKPLFYGKPMPVEAKLLLRE